MAITNAPEDNLVDNCFSVDLAMNEHEQKSQSDEQVPARMPSSRGGVQQSSDVAQLTEVVTGLTHQLSGLVCDIRLAVSAVSSSLEGLRQRKVGSSIKAMALTEDHRSEPLDCAAKSAARYDQGEQELSAVIGVIGEVARQTNRLALGASAAAIRAGTHGNCLRD